MHSLGTPSITVNIQVVLLLLLLCCRHFNILLSFSPVMIVQIAVAIFGGLLGWAYVASKPPPPKVCGLPGGPPITSPRVKLSDGRHLAYKEAGISKEDAAYKIIVCHGFDCSKDSYLPVSQVMERVIHIQSAQSRVKHSIYKN